MPPLDNPQWEIFCIAYQQSGKGGRAYKAAFPTCKDSTAYTEANRLLKRPQVIQRLRELADENRRRLNITQDRWLRELAAIGFCDPQIFFGPNGELLPITELPRWARAAISRIEVRELRRPSKKPGPRVRYGRILRYHLCDKVAALSLMGKCRSLGFLVEQHIIEPAGVGAADAVAAAKQTVLARAAGLLRPPDHVVPESEHQS